MEKRLFTQNKSLSNRSILLLGFVLICLFGIIIGLLLRNSRLILYKPRDENSWSTTEMREYANKLKADGLVDQSVRAYEDYLRKGKIDKNTRSNIYFSLGEMLMNAERYEDALAYFYKAEVANPDTGLKQEIGSAIVTCLEKSGRAQDAEYQMESRTLLKGEKGTKNPPGEVVAKIKQREITMNEINEAIEQLPPWIKDTYLKDEAKKLDFLKTYVANELFYEKGVKLGYNNDPEVRKKTEDLEKQLVIQKVLDNEVFNKIKAEEDDLRNYYEVHKDRFAEEPAIKFRYILTDSEDKAKDIITQLGAGGDFDKLAKEFSLDEVTKKKGGVVSDWVYESGYIPGVGTDKELTKQLFQLPNDKNPHLVKSEKGFYVIEISDKKDRRIKSFEEVKSEVESSYRQDKSQKAIQKLIDDMLAVKDVEIYSKKFITEGQYKKSEEKKAKEPMPKNGKPDVK